MTSPFGIGEIARIRQSLEAGGRMIHIAAAFAGAHTRDEINEAYWAIKRCPDDDWAATDHVNYVLGLQKQKVPLVNGRPTYVFKPLPARMW